MADRECRRCQKKCGDVATPFHDAPDGEGYLCAECFVCKNCKKSMEDEEQFFTLADDCFQCADCHEEQREKCTACGKPFEVGYVEVEHGKFHTECFVCCECKAPIAGAYKQKEDGTFLCQKCIAPPCSQCAAKIFGACRKNKGGALVCLTCAGMPGADLAPEDADLSALQAKAKEAEEQAVAAKAFDSSAADAARAAFLAAENAEKEAREKAAADKLAAEKAAADSAATGKIDAEKAVKEAAEKAAKDAQDAAEKADAADADAAAKQKAAAEKAAYLAEKEASEKARKEAADKAAAEKEVAQKAAAAAEAAAQATPMPRDGGPGYVPPILTMAELKDDAVWHAKGVAPSKREQSLTDDDFKAAFKMDKAAFAEAPKWKQESLKKGVGLY